MTPSRLPEYPVFFLSLSPQFTKRVQLLLIPAKHQPDLLFLRHVPLSRVHLFTAIQLACLGLLWIIKSTPAAIIFPIMVTCGRVGWCPGGSLSLGVGHGLTRGRISPLSLVLALPGWESQDKERWPRDDCEALDLRYLV